MEAPHRKAVGAVGCVLGIEPRRVEVQIVAVGVTGRTRPDGPLVADVCQRARGSIAVARDLGWRSNPWDRYRNEPPCGEAFRHTG